MNDLISAIRQAKRVAFIAHIRPDGDAVGSVLAGYHLGQLLGLEVVPVLKDGVPKAFNFLDGVDQVVTELPEDLDLCVVVDCPDAPRTGFPELVRAYASAGKLALIDHHMPGDLMKKTSVVLHDGNSPSTTVLLTDLTVAMGCKINPALATCLLTGMYTDTGGFQYGNTTNDTLDMAAELMRRGARLNKIVQHISRQRSMVGLKLLGIALSRLTLTPDKKGAVTILSRSDLQAVGGTPEDATGMVNALNVLPEVAYCLLLTELESGTVRGTLRTANGRSFDVAKFATAFGGGGHPKAAGFALPGHLAYAEGTWRVDPGLVG